MKRAHGSALFALLGDLTVGKSYGGSVGEKKSRVKSGNSVKQKCLKNKQKIADVIRMQVKVNKAGTVEESEQRTKQAVDGAQARENIKSKVRDSAEKIASGLIKVAEEGQLAPAKYLFEVAGVYPVTEETGLPEKSLAYLLLKRLGLPTKPTDDDEHEVKSENGVRETHGGSESAKE